MSGLGFEQISVVIQGPLSHNLGPGSTEVEECIESINEWLPGAEIIVSTWTGERDIKTMVPFILVQCDDPGSDVEPNGYVSNLERQKLSTLRGLQVASRPFVLKIRSDLCLTSSEFCSPLPPTPFPNEIQQSQIRMTNLFVRDYMREPALFHVSDLAQFGERFDLVNFWQAAKLTQSKTESIFSKFTLQPFPEQVQTLAWLNQSLNLSIHFPASWAGKFSDFVLWEKCLIENFTLMAWGGSGISFPKRFTANPRLERQILQVRAVEYLRRDRNALVVMLRYAKFWIMARTKGVYQGILTYLIILLRTKFPSLYAWMKSLQAG